MGEQLLKLLQCPSCRSTTLELTTDRVVCPVCRYIYPVNDGLIDFVLASDKESEIYHYYDKEYLVRHPNLDLVNSLWKSGEVLKLVTAEKLEPACILDIGCGSGEILRAVAQELGAGIAAGVDLSAENLRFAQKRNPSLVYFQAAAGHLPFRNASFDLGIMVDLLEHVEDVGQVLQEAARVCRWLVVKTPLECCVEGYLNRKLLPDWRSRFGHINFFSENSLRQLMEKNNFELVREDLAWPPWLLLGFSEAGLRAKFFVLLRYLARLSGKTLYSKVFPLWHIALCRSRVC